MHFTLHVAVLTLSLQKDAIRWTYGNESLRRTLSRRYYDGLPSPLLGTLALFTMDSVSLTFDAYRTTGFATSAEEADTLHEIVQCRTRIP